MNMMNSEQLRQLLMDSSKSPQDKVRGVRDSALQAKQQFNTSPPPPPEIEQMMQDIQAMRGQAAPTPMPPQPQGQSGPVPGSTLSVLDRIRDVRSRAGAVGQDNIASLERIRDQISQVRNADLKRRTQATQQKDEQLNKARLGQSLSKAGAMASTTASHYLLGRGGPEAFVGDETVNDIRERYRQQLEDADRQFKGDVQQIEMDRRIDEARQGQAMGQLERELEDITMSEGMDPTSQSSVQARAIVQAMFPELSQQISGLDQMSMDDIQRYIPDMRDVFKAASKVRIARAQSEAKKAEAQAKVKIEGMKNANQQLKDIAELGDKFTTRKDVQKHMEAASAARAAKQMLESGNDVGDWAAIIKIARASGEVGPLTDTDKAPFQHRQGLTGRIEDFISKHKDGQLTPEFRAQLLNLVDGFIKAADEEMAAAGMEYSQRHAPGYNLEPEDFAAKAILPGFGGAPTSDPGQPQAQGQSQQPAGQPVAQQPQESVIRVRMPDGEVYSIKEGDPNIDAFLRATTGEGGVVIRDTINR